MNDVSHSTVFIPNLQLLGLINLTLGLIFDSARLISLLESSFCEALAANVAVKRVKRISIHFLEPFNSYHAGLKVAFLLDDLEH